MKTKENLKLSLLKHQLKFNYAPIKLKLNEERDPMNYVDLFLDYTKTCESPTSFFQWAAISTLSTVMRDNVFLHWGKLKIYPNLYVMLLADSAVCRKSTPLKTANKLMRKIDNTKIIEGRSSIQGIVSELAKISSSSNGNMSQKKGACGLLYAEEFSASLVNDPAVIPLLTDLYDYRDVYDVILRDSTTTLKNVCLGMLVATNSTLLQEIYTKAAKEGGLIGRTIVIHEQKRRHTNSMIFEEPDDPNAEKPMIDHLMALSKIKGAVDSTLEAKMYYDEWYHSLDTDQEDKTGFLGRIQTGVGKLAMILAAAEREIVATGKILIKLKHMEEAVILAGEIKHNQQAIVMGQGESLDASKGRIFLMALSKARCYQLSRREILKKHWSDINNTDLESITTTFINAGLIRETSVLNETGYQLTERCIHEVFKFTSTNNSLNNSSNNSSKVEAAKKK